MAKTKTVFYCTNCGNETPKWMGRCPSCGAYNTMEEHVEKPGAAGKAKSAPVGMSRKPQRIREITSDGEIRFSTGMGELDRVLGGGAVAGSLVLVGGAPGIGKSTQADLWQRYEGAELLNGDRTVLRRMDGVWTAFGSPYAGSSNCFVNESRPVRAIVLLSQGSACSLRRLSPAAAFRGLYAGMTVNLWDDRYVARVCDLLAALDVPVYALTCTPDRAAVDCLKAELEHETA